MAVYFAMNDSENKQCILPSLVFKTWYMLYLSHPATSEHATWRSLDPHVHPPPLWLLSSIRSSLRCLEFHSPSILFHWCHTHPPQTFLGSFLRGIPVHHPVLTLLHSRNRLWPRLQAEWHPTSVLLGVQTSLLGLLSASVITQPLVPPNSFASAWSFRSFSLVFVAIR